MDNTKKGACFKGHVLYCLIKIAFFLRCCVIWSADYIIIDRVSKAPWSREKRGLNQGENSRVKHYWSALPYFVSSWYSRYEKSSVLHSWHLHPEMSPSRDISVWGSFVFSIVPPPHPPPPTHTHTYTQQKQQTTEQQQPHNKIRHNIKSSSCWIFFSSSPPTPPPYSHTHLQPPCP